MSDQDWLFEAGVLARGPVGFLAMSIVLLGAIFILVWSVYGYAAYSVITVGALLLFLFLGWMKTKRFQFYQDGVRIVRGFRILSDFPYSQITDFELRYHRYSFWGGFRSWPVLCLVLIVKNEKDEKEKEEIMPLSSAEKNYELGMDLVTFLNQRLAQEQF